MLEKIFSFENLYKAHKAARLGKRDKIEVIDFELNLSRNLTLFTVGQKLNLNDLHTDNLYDYAKDFEIFAVRRKGSSAEYNRCRYFLKLLSREYGSMSDRDIPPEYFKSQETILEYTLSFPEKNELMDFLKDKELILLMDYNKSTD